MIDSPQVLARTGGRELRRIVYPAEVIQRKVVEMGAANTNAVAMSRSPWEVAAVASGGRVKVSDPSTSRRTRICVSLVLRSMVASLRGRPRCR